MSIKTDVFSCIATPEPPRPNIHTKPSPQPNSPAALSPPHHTFPRTRPLSFHASSSPAQLPPVRPQAASGLSFPQPSINHSFYGAMPYPPEPTSHSFNVPPPRHPSTHPRSFHTSSPGENGSYGGYSPGYFRS